MSTRIGEILLESGNVSEEELQKALQLQKKTPVKLGQILIKKGVISEEDVLEALSKQFRIQYSDKLEVNDIEYLVDRVPLKFVQKYRMAPFARDKKGIRIAISDPTALHPLDEFKLLFIGEKVEAVLARESEILRIIHNYYEAEDREEGADVDIDENFDMLEGIEDIHDATDLANQAPIIKMVNVILSNAVNERASDIHIEPQEKELVVRYRVDGIMHRVLSPPKSIQSGIISRIKIMANLNIAENRLPQDGRIKIRFGGKDIDLRVSSLPTQYGERVVLRLLNKTDASFELDKIGFPASVLKNFRSLLDESNGIVLITGPTGSGKTTTLYAALSELNNESRNIITVEDPVEYQISGIGQVQARPNIGLSFADGLRSILRQDPDVIMVGEIRDEETARVAIQSSLTGHLVFSTLHTNDAPSAVTRLLDMGIEPYLVSSTCRGVMAQRLVRTLCKHCRKKTSVDVSELKSLGSDLKTRKKKLTVYEPAGCKECMHTGYRGRTGIYELLIIDNQIRDAVINNESVDTVRKLAVKNGMTSLRESAIEKVIDGQTSLEEALRVT